MDRVKKALIVTTVSGFVPQFEMSNVKILQKKGYEIHYASNFNNPTYSNDNLRLKGTGIIMHQIDFIRSPFVLWRNLKVYYQLKKLMEDLKFDLFHCHTPMGGLMTRLAGKKTNTRYIIYTAHGFHFYKGAPFINWLIYYPIERLLSRYTDILITINQEDFLCAQKFHAGKVQYIPGIGIDTKKISDIEVSLNEKRKELAIPNTAFVVVSVGEINKNKNHRVIIEALASLRNPDIYYIICGNGKQITYLKELVHRFNLDNQVKFLGYRKDIIEILKISDLYAFPSKREGLPVSLMEAMACGLPVVCSDIRGNNDLIVGDKGGFLLGCMDIDGFKQAIYSLNRDLQLRLRMGLFNLQNIKKFDVNEVVGVMENLYHD